MIIIHYNNALGLFTLMRSLGFGGRSLSCLNGRLRVLE